MRYLDHISSLFVVPAHYTHINTCYMLLTVPMYTMLELQNIRTSYHFDCLLLPYRVCRGLGNIALNNTITDILIVVTVDH